MSTHICSYSWTGGFNYFIECTLLPTCAHLRTCNLISILFSCSSNHGDSVCLQWLVGNVVGRDDTLYARMKQRDLDGHDSMWEPIFVDDAAIGLGDQKNKVQQKPKNPKIHLHHYFVLFFYVFWGAVEQDAQCWHIITIWSSCCICVSKHLPIYTSSRHRAALPFI